MTGSALAWEIESVGKLILLPLTLFPEWDVPAVILTFLRPFKEKDFDEPGEIFLIVLPTL